MIIPSTSPAVVAAALGVVLCAAVLGVLIIPYGIWVGDSAFRIIALPAVLALVLLLVVDKTKLFFLIILLRASIDPIVAESRGIAFFGLGAALNAFILLIALTFVVQQPRTAMRVVLPIWGPLLLVVFIAAARAPDLVTAVRGALVLLSYAAVFTVPLYIYERGRDMRLCIYIVLLSCIGPALVGIVEFAMGAARLDGRLASTLGHPNIFAFYLVLTISLAFYLAKSHTFNISAGQRLLLMMYIGVLLSLLVLTKTRAAWAACATIFLVFGILFERRYLIYLILAGALALLVPDIRERLSDVFYGSSLWGSGLGSINSYEWREILWRSALNWMQWKDMPLGYGLGSFSYYSLQFIPSALWPAHIVGGPSAHNVYIQWFFETGFVGIICAAWLYFRLSVILGKNFTRDKMQTVIVIAIIFGYLVACSSDNMLNYLPLNWSFWFVLGSACAVSIAARERGSDPAQAHAL